MIFNKKNQGTRGKLHNFIEEYKMRELYPLHMPGHKQNFGEISQYDYTEIPYFDDLHDPSGLILDIMEGYSKIYGVGSTYLSINGSTAGILAAISALNLFGKNFLVARNCHKSVYNAIFINKIKAKYFGPYVNKSNIVVGYDYDDIEREIVNNNIGVLILTSPTYEGIKFDLSKVYDICKKNKVLIIPLKNRTYIWIYI